MAIGCAGATPQVLHSAPTEVPLVASASTSTTAPQVAPKGGGDEGAAAIIGAACESYIELLVRHDPEEATDLGRHEYDTKLTDRSDLAQEARRRDLAALLAHTEASVQGRTLSPTAQTDLDVLGGLIRYDLLHDAALDPLHRMPDVYVDGPLGAVFALVAREDRAGPDRARAALARIQALPASLEIAKHNLIAGTKGENKPPKVWIENGIRSAQNARPFLKEQRAFLLAALPAQDVDDALRNAASALSGYARFLGALPGTTGTFKVGPKVFAELLKARYGLTKDLVSYKTEAEESFARITAEMTVLAQRRSPNRSLTEVLAQLKQKHPKAADLRSRYEQEVARARAFLAAKDVVSFPPGDKVNVVDTPAFLRATTGAAYDRPPPFGNAALGLFYVTPVDLTRSNAEQESVLREHDDADIVDTAVHEAYPGHHLQLSVARVHAPPIRKVFSTPILSEGWALYSEELMHELGYYSDEERLMQLEWARVRAARVAIDIELSAYALTPDQAIEKLVREVGLERPLATSEVRRYVKSPTQPMAYWVGRQAILTMRKRALDRGWTLKAFHDAVLRKGSIPPAFIERELFE